ncbi:hypothetical protein ACTFIW_010964 [Dictyostelium discoideum]
MHRGEDNAISNDEGLKRPTFLRGVSNFKLINNIGFVSDEKVKSYLKTEILVKEWLEKVLGIKIQTSLFEALRNGVILCDLINVIQENTVPSIVYKSKFGFEFRGNIEFFLLGLKDFGFPPQKLFFTDDLFKGENIVKVVECLSCLGRFACEKKDFTIEFPKSSNVQIRMPTEDELVNLKLLLSQIKDYSSNVKFNFNQKQKPGGTLVIKKKIEIISSNKVDYKKCEKGFLYFQALWKGYKVRQVYLKLKRNIIHRKKITDEILKTETDYVKNLNICIKFYMEPLLQKEIISKEQSRMIFSDIIIIYNFGKTFLEELEKRCGNNWKIYTKLSDMFLSISSFLKVYSSYVENYDNSIAAIKDLKKNSDKFNSMMNEVNNRSETGGSEIDSFLILPIQRVPRYFLLLTELVKNTWTDHPDYQPLKEAVEKIKSIATFLNERKRKVENFQKFTEILSNLVGKSIPNNLFQPSRFFIKEFLFLNQKKKQDSIIYLFNDIIIMGTPRSSNNKKVRFNGIIDLSNSIVLDDEHDKEQQEQLQLQNSINHNNDSEPEKPIIIIQYFNQQDQLEVYTIYCKNELEKSNLKSEINKLINQLRENRKTINSDVDESVKIMLNTSIGGSTNIGGGISTSSRKTLSKSMIAQNNSNNNNGNQQQQQQQQSLATSIPTTASTANGNGSNNNSNNSSPRNGNVSSSPPSSPSIFNTLFQKRKTIHPSELSASLQQPNSNSSTPPIESPSNTSCDEADNVINGRPRLTRKKKFDNLLGPDDGGSSLPTGNNNNDDGSITPPPTFEEQRARSKSVSTISKITGHFTLKRKGKVSLDENNEQTLSQQPSSTTTTTPPTPTTTTTTPQTTPTTTTTPSSPPPTTATPPPPTTTTTTTTATPTPTTTTTTTKSNSQKHSQLSSSAIVNQHPNGSEGTYESSPLSVSQRTSSSNSITSVTIDSDGEDNHFSDLNSHSDLKTGDDNDEMNIDDPNFTYIPYETIVANKKSGAYDVFKLESYINNQDFKRLFGQNRSEFYKLPKWRQNQKKFILKLY